MTQHRSNFKEPVRKRKESVSVPRNVAKCLKVAFYLVYIYLGLYICFCFFFIVLFYQTCVKDYQVISSWKNLVQTIIVDRKPSASIKMVVIHGCHMLVGFQK